MRIGGGLWAVVLGAMLAGSAHADEPAWVRQAVSGHPLALELPGVPHASHVTTSWFLGTAETDKLVVEAFGGQLEANATLAPMTAIRIAGNPLIFSTTRGTVLKARGGEMVSWTDVRRGAYEGKRMTYVVDENGKKRFGTLEVFVVDSHILTFDALLPEGAPADAVDRFFRSIELPAEP